MSRLTKIILYEAFLSGKLEDYEYPEAQVQASLAALPNVGA